LLRLLDRAAKLTTDVAQTRSNPGKVVRESNYVDRSEWSQDLAATCRKCQTRPKHARMSIFVRRPAPVTSCLFLRYCLQGFKVSAEAPSHTLNDAYHLMVDLFSNKVWITKMGEVIRFIPKSERERARLIREARAIYDSIFPPSGTVSKDTAPLGHAVSGANAYRSDRVLLS
jgi:hypothetical protein